MMLTDKEVQMIAFYASGRGAQQKARLRALLTDRAELKAEVERLEAAYMQMGMRAAELEYTVQHHEAEIGRLRAVVEAAKAAIGECAWTPKCDALAALEVGE